MSNQLRSWGELSWGQQWVASGPRILSSVTFHYCALQSAKHRADYPGGSVTPGGSRAQTRRRSRMELCGGRVEEWPPSEAKHYQTGTSPPMERTHTLCP